MARAASERIDTVWDEALEPDLRVYTATVARQVLAEEQLRGFDERPIRFVDRRTNAPVESVKLFGVIEFVSRADIAEAARWIYGRLIQISPYLSGDYQKSHLVFLNKTKVGDMEAALKQYKPGDRIQIVNTQPYARKIEGRKASKAKGGALKPLSKQAPNGVYRAVYAAARRKFTKSLFLDFTYRRLEIGGAETKAWGYVGGAHFSAKKNQGDIRRRKRARRPIVYPMIQIYQTAAGLEGSPT